MKKGTNLNLLFILLSVCYGGATEQLPQDIFAAEGSQVMFPMQEKLQINQIWEGKCNEFTWQVIPIHKKMKTTIMSADNNCNPHMFYGNSSSVSHNGSLLLYNITREDAGKYIVTVDDLRRARWFETTYILHIQVPLSDPVIEVSCESKKMAVLTCRVQSGTDPYYTWLTQGTIKKNIIPPGEVNGNIITVPLPFPRVISCRVRNNVTEKRVSLSIVRCPGGATEQLPQDIFAAEGSQVMFPMQEKLQISQTQEGTCNQFTWQVKKFHRRYRETISWADALCNPLVYYGNYQLRSSVSHNGSLLLYNITREDAGKYVVTVDNLRRARWFSKIFILHVQGGATEQLPQDIFAAEGSQVMFPMQEKLQISQTQEGTCNQFTWQVKKFHRRYRETISWADALCNPLVYYGNYQPRSSVSHNGSLLLYNITREDAGKYIVTVDTLARTRWFKQIYLLHVERRFPSKYPTNESI
ncbi:uncharacterized protein LOC108707780 isoform X2 [Xenopus laevis]|uniref:Uncharacterized protein LOC108707780 isoform X2 n=1 Tax=Xenopus laevis TaxID=8355 RepID=A0A8J1M6I2_XENLA|nr:uncharacterized protein LOC108707780 isoform X2 [Xenopus laevis]